MRSFRDFDLFHHFQLALAIWKISSHQTGKYDELFFPKLWPLLMNCSIDWPWIFVNKRIKPFSYIRRSTIQNMNNTCCLLLVVVNTTAKRCESIVKFDFVVVNKF